MITSERGCSFGGRGVVLLQNNPNLQDGSPRGGMERGSRVFISGEGKPKFEDFSLILN